jgi:hypothetical protein
MPNVKDLKMNLYDEEHVDFIMRVMPQLQYLNGLPVEREEEEEEEGGDREAEERPESRRMKEISASDIIAVGSNHREG